MHVARLGCRVVCAAILAASACGDDVAGPDDDVGGSETTGGTSEAGESTGGTTETDSEDSGDTDTSESEGPDPIPEECIDSAYVLDECVLDALNELCEDVTHLAVPICSDAVSGPRELGFSSGLWACGCYAPSTLVARDLDGDGADELLVPCWEGPHQLVIWKGRRDGELSCGTAHAVTGDIVWVRDVDEDGIDDLVLLAQFNPFVSVLYASSPGEYEPFVPVGALGPSGLVGDPVELDVDGDGRAELLTATDSWPDPGPLAVWTSEAGTITVQTDVFDAPLPRRIHGADIDGDGWLDLVAGADPNWWARGSVAGLGPVELLDDSIQLEWHVLGDVDGDGLADLVIGGETPTIQLGLGDGSFGTPSSPPALGAPEDAGGEAKLVRDLDGDGLAEIVMSNYDLGWNIWRSTSEGLRWDFHADLETHLYFTSGDFDGDGRIDLASSPPLAANTNGQVTVWRADP